MPSYLDLVDHGTMIGYEVQTGRELWELNGELWLACEDEHYESGHVVMVVYHYQGQQLQAA